MHVAQVISLRWHAFPRALSSGQPLPLYRMRYLKGYWAHVMSQSLISPGCPSELIMLKSVVHLNLRDFQEGVCCLGLLLEPVNGVLQRHLALPSELNDALVDPAELAVPGCQKLLILSSCGREPLQLALHVTYVMLQRGAIHQHDLKHTHCWDSSAPFPPPLPRTPHPKLGYLLRQVQITMMKLPKSQHQRSFLPCHNIRKHYWDILTAPVYKVMGKTPGGCYKGCEFLDLRLSHGSTASHLERGTYQDASLVAGQVVVVKLRKAGVQVTVW